MSAEEQNAQQPPADTPAKEPKEVVLGEDGKPLSKGELKKRAKEAESQFRVTKTSPLGNSVL